MYMRRFTFMLAALALLLAACGGDDSDTSDGSDSEASTDDDETGDFVEDLVDDLEGQQASQGGGSATLTVGDMTYTFDSVLCAFGEDQIGQAGAEFNLSSIQDGMQMYASIDSFGHSVSLDDIVDFENPSVSLSSTFGAEFITLDGKNVTAEGEFLDGTTDSLEPIPGTFTATCP